MSRKTLVELENQISDKQVIAPYVYDCLGSRMAENSGFRTFVLSSSELSMRYGMPDLGLLTCDDVIAAASRVSDFLPYPVIVDFAHGFGGTPYVVYHNISRLLGTDVAGVMIDDTTGVHGGARLLTDKVKCDVVTKELFYSKIAAAIKACENTKCKVIAVTNSKYSLGMEESIKRLKKCKELGADIVVCRGMTSMNECEALGVAIEGPKMLDEFKTSKVNGDIDLKEIQKWGFNIVSVRYIGKASLFGFMQFGLRTKADNTTVYVDYHDFDGMLPELHYRLRLSTQWNELSKEIRDLSALKR